MKNVLVNRLCSSSSSSSNNNNQCISNSNKITSQWLMMMIYTIKMSLSNRNTISKIRTIQTLIKTILMNIYHKMAKNTPDNQICIRQMSQ